MIQRFWRALKVRRSLTFGPLSLAFQFARAAQMRFPTRGQGVVSRRSVSAPEQKLELFSEGKGRAGVALLVGAGPGLGESMARKLAANGFDLALASRDGRRLEALAAKLVQHGGRLATYACDATSELSVDEMFSCLDRDMGTPDLVVYALQSFGPGDTVSVEVSAFEESWRHNCFGSFLVSRAACRRMADAGRGTLVLVGSTSSVLGRAGHLNLAAGKFGQRAIAQVLSREMWKRGVHVVHVLIDADIREESGRSVTQSDPDDIADTLLFLHRQPRSAWTSEIDLRPWDEKFWEHC